MASFSSSASGDSTTSTSTTSNSSSSYSDYVNRRRLRQETQSNYYYRTFAKVDEEYKDDDEPPHVPVIQEERRRVKMVDNEQTSLLSRLRDRDKEENKETDTEQIKPGAMKWNIVKNAINTEKLAQQYQKRGCNSMIYMGEINGVGKPVNKWYRGLVVRQSCHSHLASDYLYRDLYMNTLSVALTAITSSAIFTSLSPAAASSSSTTSQQQEEMVDIDLNGDATTSSDINSYPIDTSNSLALAAGCIAALNTVLQAVMRTLQYATRGEQHLAAYKQFSKLRFKLENIIGDKPKYGHHENIDNVLLDVWIAKYEEALEMSPIIPQRIFAHVAEDHDIKGDLKWTKEIRSNEDAEAIDAAAKKIAKKMILFPGISKLSRPSYF